MKPEYSSERLVEHFFRHEYGKTCAILTKSFGFQRIDLVEDTVQSALLAAVQTWKTKGIPNNPSAWIYQVAKNRVIDVLRRESKYSHTDIESTESLSFAVNDAELNDEAIDDDVLRMIFACCHPDLPTTSSIPLTLKLVGGFSEKEIASALLQSGDTVRKRIYRAKKNLAEMEMTLSFPNAEELENRLETVHLVLYLMFNEGYRPTEGNLAVKEDLCEEATRLCFLLCNEERTRTKTTMALLSLMLFQASRLTTRIDEDGNVMLLEQQDRRNWDQVLIRRGLHYLKMADTDLPTTYHLEARIAMNHSTAKDFDSTNWPQIRTLYQRLYHQTKNPVYLVNHAIAVGYDSGPTEALDILLTLKENKSLKSYPWVDAAIGTFFLMDSKKEQAIPYFESAIEKTSLVAEKKLLEKKIVQAKETSPQLESLVDRLSEG